MNNKHSIFDHTLASFVDILYQEVGRGKEQIAALYKYFYKNGSLQADLPCLKNGQQLFAELVQRIDTSLPKIQCVQEMEETRKILLRTEDGFDIESVIIPMKEGLTLCVSSQIGCKMGCAFCETGKMGLLRNLSVREITTQLACANRMLQEKATLPQPQIRNVVFMGMGEPFDNYDNVMKAIDIMTDQNGFAIGMQRITVSTSGRLDGLRKISEDTNRFPNIAVSVNAADDQLRNKLMPWNRKENLAMLYDAMRSYHEKTGREILAAYVLIGGVNDTVQHAESLARYLQGLFVKVNIIPYNPQAKDSYTMPSGEAIEYFMDILRKAGFRVLLRKTKGRDVMAACGQLGNRKLRHGQEDNKSLLNKV